MDWPYFIGGLIVGWLLGQYVIAPTIIQLIDRYYFKR